MKIKTTLTAIAALIASSTCLADGGDTYNAANGQLLLPTITVGGVAYTNVIVTIGSIISVNAPPPAPVAATCTPANFTLAALNAITVGMTLAQVNQVIGCANFSAMTARQVNYVLYGWAATGLGGGQLIQVYFDASGTIVTQLAGLTYFKSSQGF